MLKKAGKPWEVPNYTGCQGHDKMKQLSGTNPTFSLGLLTLIEASYLVMKTLKQVHRQVEGKMEGTEASSQ